MCDSTNYTIRGLIAMMSCSNVPKAKLEFFNHNMELNTSIIASVVCELTFCQCK